MAEAPLAVVAFAVGRIGQGVVELRRVAGASSLARAERLRYRAYIKHLDVIGAR